MAVVETWLKSDLKKPVQVVQLQGNLFSGDNGGNLIGVEVLNNGSPATLTGGVTGYIVRADGATVVVNGTLTGNRASIVLPASAYVVVGQVSIVVKVSTTTVGACVAYVYRTTTDTIVDPGHVIPSIEELLAKIADCEAATTAANTAASSANTAASNANTKANLADQKATLADQKATAANTAATAANTAATKIDDMTVAAQSGTTAGAVISEVSGHKHIQFTLPKGDPGEVTEAELTAVAESKADAINVQIDTPASVMTFSDGADGMPLSATFEIAPVQSGSGDPSPTNVRPITGWTGCEVTSTNNLLDTSLYTITSNKYINVTDGSIGSTGGYCYINEYIPVEHVTYAMQCSKTASESRGIYAIYYDADKAFLSSDTVVENTSSKGIIGGTFTPPATAKYARFDIANFTAGTLILQKGSAVTVTTSSCTTLDIDFPAGAGTVYGGTLTVNKDGTGKLVVDRSLITVDGTETFNDVTSANVFYIQKNDFSTFAVSSSDDYCSMFKPVAATGSSAMSDGEIARQSTANARIHVKSSVFSGYTAAQLGTYFTNNNMQVCFKLATPVSYDLTATDVGQILSLLGTNNLFCDTGDVLSVSYTADTKLYIEKLTQPTEDDMTANANIASGKFFMVGNFLFLSTQAIAQGATIIPGTNCTAFSLAEALNTINQ